MRITILVDTCVGSGTCAYVAEEFFTQEPDLGTVVVGESHVPPDSAAVVRKGVQLCPVEAILPSDD
jgi:ferredoxin